MFTVAEPLAPSRRTDRSSSTRRSLACVVGVNVLSSSRKTVPLSASSKSPLWSATGSGEGPFVVAEKLTFQEGFRNSSAVVSWVRRPEACRLGGRGGGGGGRISFLTIFS